MAVETLLNSSFLQVFLWERFKGIEVSPLPYSKVKESADSDGGAYVLEKLPLICRWFRRMQRKGQNFLELLDNVENFIFRPYCALSEGFRHAPLYADSDDLLEVPATTARGRWLRREALLSAARFPLPTLGDDHLEASVYYGAHRVRRQLGFDQGVPSDPSHGDPFSLHKVFWTEGNVPDDGSLFALALADQGRVGGLSKAYRSYWNCCFASFSRFHAAHCDRLLPTVIYHARLVSEEKAISLSEKRNLPFTSRSGEIVGDFSKLKQKLEKPSSRSAGKSATHGKRKREESPSVEKKRHAAKSPKKFIPKVAASGPPSSKKNAPTVPLLQQQPVASVSSKQVDKMPEAVPSRSTSQVRDKGEKAPMVLRHRSMRILQTQFAGTRKGKGAGSGSDVVVVADDDDDDDDGSNEGDAVRTGVSIHEQGSAHSTNGTDEDLDEDQYYSCDEGTYPDADAHSKERDTSDMPPRLASSPERRMHPELVEGTPQGLEGVPLTPPIDAATIVTPLFPAATIPTSTLLDIAAGTTPDIPAASVHASILADIAAGTIPDLPAASTLASALLDIAAGTTSDLPAASILGGVPDVGHPIGSASTNVHAVECLSEKSTSWQDWETSFMAFKAVFDGGVKVLRSIDELLPLCYRFNGYAIFLGAFVYPETTGALRKFMYKYGCFAEVTGITSSFSRSAAFQALGLVLHGMDTMELLDITDHRLLCWRDAICEAMTLGFPVDFLLSLVRNLARAVFGARAIDSMRSLPGSDEIKAVADALNLKQRELEDKHREFQTLLLVKGVLIDSAECVAEAAARSSLKASSVLFGHPS